MHILLQRQRFFNRQLSAVPEQLHRLFLFGCATLALQPVVSLRSNARQLAGNFNTAKSRIYRLCANGRWPWVFPLLLAKLKLVSERSLVAVGFSAFGDFQVLTFALSLGVGRALPVYFEIIQYPLTKGSQNLFIRDAAERFVKHVGCRPKFVMDRGFAAPFLIEHLAAVGHRFIVRIKGIKTLTCEEKDLILKARQAPENDLAVRVYDGDLRLVVSDDPENGNERWYLITNDSVSVRDGIINDYYRRFEIEEFFKDAKWLQGLERLRVKTIRSLTAVLWFALLGWWFMAALERNTPVLQGRHPHDKLSFPRLITEALERAEQEIVYRWLSDRGCVCALPG